MKSITVSNLTIMLLLSLSGGSPSFGADITIFDNNSTMTGSGWYGKHGGGKLNEDQEVEPGNVANQSWDLEAMLQNERKLTVAGGFNFIAGNTGYFSGDLFIDTDGSAGYGSSIATSSTNNYRNVQNTFGYDYVYDLNFINLTYDVYKIDGDAVVQTTYFGSNFESNPFQYVSGGTKIGSGTISYVSGKTDSETTAAFGVSLTGGTHNAFTIDLGFLPFDTDFIAHFTIGCGNDSIIGEGRTPVPEPATMILLGSGLVGIASFGRKKMRLQ